MGTRLTTIELVRHAKAVSRKVWNGQAEGRRPLTDKGHAQARGLASTLAAGDPPDFVYSSPLTRCLQTCEPLAAAAGVPVDVDERLGEAVGIPVADNGSAWVGSAWLGGRALGLVDELVARHEDCRLVLCSHGDVIPALLAALVGRDDIDLTDVRLRKGARVTLRFDGDRCVAAQKTPAPSAPEEVTAPRR